MPLNLLAEVLLQDLARYVVGAGGVYLVLNLALRRRLGRQKIRAAYPASAQYAREVVTSLRTVAIFALIGTGVTLGARTGLLRVYFDVPEHGFAYLALSTVLCIIAHDAFFYWSHRLMHRPRLFRLLHRTHHRSHNPTPFTSYSFDPGEAVIHAIFLPVFLMLVPMHPVAILVFTGHMMLRNAIGHSGVEIFPAGRSGKPVFGWLTTVTHHDLHHAHAGYNLGLYFTWWDRWMGTEHPDYHAEYARVAPRLRPGNGVAVLLVIALALGIGATRSEAKELTGAYAPPGLHMIVRFGKCHAAGVQTCGTLLWTWNDTGRLHARPGDIVVRGLEWNGQSWRGGTLVDPESGRTYRGSATPTGSGSLLLKGCAGPFCSTQVWRPLDMVCDSLARL